jgi:cytochrome c-type biogenesis protein CcmH
MDSSSSVAVGRRGFLYALGGVAASLPAVLAAQDANNIPGATMEGDGYIPVRRPPKEGATTFMSRDERDATERKLACPCPCTLDIFTCRTSMPCGFSPRMHADVVSLADGGYTEAEILQFFEEAYGEVIRMAPRARGFNLLGWVAPFLAILAGGAFVVWVLRGWKRNAIEAAPSGVTTLPVDATDEELERLQRAIRGEDA